MSRSNCDPLVTLVLRVIGGMACLLLILIIGFLMVDSWPAATALGTRIFSDDSWFPEESAANGKFGIVPMVLGTLAVTGGAMLIAVPAGISSALFCEFFAPRVVSTIYRRLVEILAGVPSVVFGFWGLVTLAPLIARWHPPGPSLICGILIVGLMIVPTIMLVSGQALAAVPIDYRRSAVALGVGRLAFIGNVAIPAARSGLIAAVVLGAARAIGETMAVVMVCGNIVKVPKGLFDPVRTLTANIAMEMGYAVGDHRSALFLSGLILMAVVILLITIIPLFGTAGARADRGRP